MSVKTPRKTKIKSVYKIAAPKKVRRSAPKHPSKPNGKSAPGAYEALHVGIVEASPKGKYIDANQEFCRILGYSKKELLRRSVKDCTHADDFGLDMKLHEQLVRGEIPFYGLEKRYVRKDGGIIWVELTRSLVRDEVGKPLYTVGVVTDISEHKHVERVLRESAESLRLATEAARMFKWELDLQQQLYTFSDNFEQVIGFSAGLLPQNSVETVLSFSPPEDAQTISDSVANAIENHTDLNSLQYRVIDPASGQTVWLEVNAKIVYDDQGNPQRMFGVAQNITEDKRKEEELRELNRQLKRQHDIFDMTLSSVQDSIYRFDRSGRILYANQPLLDIWGLKREDAIGKSMADLNYPKEVEQRVLEGLQQVLTTKQTVKNETFYTSPLGESGYYENILTPVCAEDGTVEFITGSSRDVTERKRAEQALTEYARQQAALYQLVDQLRHTNSLADVYNSALEAILSAVQCDRASILLFDDTGVMRFVAWRGLSYGYRKATEGHSPWTLDEKNPYPVCVNDIRTADLSDSLKTTIQEEGISSLAFIPLVSNGKLIGKFMMYFNTPHECTDAEIELGLMIARQLAFGIDRIQAENALLASEAKLQAELADLKQLQITSSQLIREDNINILYEQIITAALALMRSDMASLQMFHPEKNELQLLAWKGFHPESAAFWEWVRVDSKSFCALAMNKGERVIETDVEASDLIAGSADFDHYRLSGIKAMQSTPLVSRDGRLVGMISTHWREMHQPSERELRLFDVLARQAADLMERKRHQAALQARMEEIEALFKVSPIGIFIAHDPACRRITANPAGRRLVGLPDQDDVNISKSAPPEERPAYRVFRDGEEMAAEDLPMQVAARLGTEAMEDSLELRFEDGSHKYIYTYASPLFDENGKTRGAIAAMLDITERKQAEEKLRANEALYRTIARSIPGGGVYVVDKDFRYLVAEGTVTEAFGLSRERLEGHTVSEVFPPEVSALMEDRLQQTFAGETISFETKYNGRAYWTQQAPLLDSIGQAIIVTIDITERKQAEEALRQSEERFVRFMEHLPGLAWIKDAQGCYMYANAAAEKAFSIPREKFYGKTDHEIFPPEVAVEFRKNDEQALSSEKGMQTVETLQQEDGILHYSLVSKFPIPDVDGRATLIGGIAFDITERLRAEEALHESEERLRAILSQATAGIVRKDSEGRLVFVNEAFCNMLGYNESELLGKPIWQLTHSEDVEENKRLFERLMLEGLPFKLEKRLIRRDGSLLWVDVSVSPIMTASGKPQSAVAVEVDITARKQAEEELQQLNLQLESRVQKRTTTIQAINQTLRDEIAERKRVEAALRASEASARASEETLRTLFDLLPVGISFLDPQGQILQMNAALSNILKSSNEQLLGQEHKSRKYIRADGRPMPPEEFASARALRENRTIYNVETGIILENGQVIWTSVSAAPVNVADVGVVVVTVDITDNKRAEQALQESHRRLRILSQRLVEVQEDERRALARELHDRVGQTLAALNINLIIINSQLPADSLQQIGARMNDSMKLVAETIALVRDVMTDLRPAVLDDYGLEAALESQLSKFTSRYTIKTVFEKPDQPVPRLGASVEMTLLRIAQEALMNIARHSYAEHVTLSLRQDEQDICLMIKDDGIGIESWQDANRPGSHGLTIMRERAEAFGGKLRVKSVPNQGTLVEVSIPWKNDGPGQAQKEQSL